MIVTSEENLRVECDDVRPDEIDALRAKLESELELSAKKGFPGIGLACPQIGIAKRMAIVRINKKLSVDLVNPVIESGYYKQVFEGEGCLSFPTRYEKTMRYQEVVVKSDASPNFFIAKGLFAVAVQHEIDHLNGVLLPDVALKQVHKNKIRPNDLCFCGSNKKYKKCCGK